jgi:hypothetical protein
MLGKGGRSKLTQAADKHKGRSVTQSVLVVKLIIITQRITPIIN